MNDFEKKTEKELIEDLGENPMRPYKLEFPYQVKFHLAEDDNRTEVIINTISEEMTFARTRKDALLQKEKNDAVSKDGYTKLSWSHLVGQVGSAVKVYSGV